MACPNLHFSAKSLSSALKQGLTARWCCVGNTTWRSDTFSPRQTPVQLQYNQTKLSQGHEWNSTKRVQSFPSLFMTRLLKGTDISRIINGALGITRPVFLTSAKALTASAVSLSI